MNIALYDGNNDDLKKLEECLRTQVGYEHDIETFNKGTELLDTISRNQKEFDIHFLSIETNKLSGLKIAEEIRKVDLTALIIFLSDDAEQMSNVFEFHAFDYLIKPVTVEIMESTFQRAKKYLNGNQSYIEFSFKKEKFLLPMDEIVYVTKSGRIAFIHTKNEVYKSYLTMFEILNKLNDERFIRVHGSYVINLDYVARIVKDEVFLCAPGQRGSANETSISISRRFKDDFQLSVEHLKIGEGR